MEIEISSASDMSTATPTAAATTAPPSGSCSTIIYNCQPCWNDMSEQLQKYKPLGGSTYIPQSTQTAPEPGQAQQWNKYIITNVTFIDLNN